MRVLIYTASINVYALWRFVANCGRQWNDLVVEGEKQGYS